MNEKLINDIVEYLLVQKKFKEAENFCNNSIDPVEFLFEVFCNLGKVYFYQGKPVEAQTFFEKAVSTDPKKTEASCYLSQIKKVINGETDEKDAANDEELIRIAEELIEDQRLFEAKFLLEEFLLNKDDINALNDLAIIYIFMEKFLTAELLLKKVISLEPCNEVAVGNLNYLEENYQISKLKDAINEELYFYENHSTVEGLNNILRRKKIREFSLEISDMLKTYSDEKFNTKGSIEAIRSLAIAGFINQKYDSWKTIEESVEKTATSDIYNLLVLFNEWMNSSYLNPHQLLIISKFLGLNNIKGGELEFELKGLKLQSVLSDNKDERLESVIKEKSNKLDNLINKTKGLKDIVFYSLNCSGVTAIEPIIREILVDQYNYDNVFDHYSNLITPFAQSNIPFYHWTHCSIGSFNGLLKHKNVKFICLIRDPRDACISYSKYLDYLVKNGWPEGWPERHFENERDGLINVIETIWPGYMQAAYEWYTLCNNENGFIIRFEDMKKDILQTIRDVFNYFELPLDEQILKEKFDKYSFESITKQKRGEEKIVMPGKYYYRKGSSGDWKDYFDAEISTLFYDRCGDLMKKTGYC